MTKQQSIGKIDAKILKMLLRESRTSFTEMARSCNISVCAARMRYNRLKKDGVIVGEHMHLNPRFWGYECTADIAIETSMKSEREVMEFLKSKRYVLKANFFGIHDIMGLVVLPKTDKLGKVLEEIEANPKIKHVETLIWTENQNIDHIENLIINPSTDPVEKQKPLLVEVKEAQIDDIDKQIAKILSQNSRAPFNQIARALKISTNSVIKRYKMLREIGAISRSTISLNLEKLGYKAMYLVFVKLTNRSYLTEVFEKIVKIPNAINLIKHMGIYDLRVDFPIINVEDVFIIDKAIQEIDGIEKIHVDLKKVVAQWPNNLYSAIA